MACVCRAVAGLYRRPHQDSEILTQELLGHRVKVHSERKGFIRCTLRDGCSGWLPVSSVADAGEYAATHVVSQRFARVSVKGGSPLLVCLGSLMKVTSKGKRRHTVELPDGRTGWVAARRIEELAEWERHPPRISALLDKLTGTPYLWGGKSSFGFDCSGLVQLVFGLIGVGLPRDSGEQARKGRLIHGLDRLKVFDLLFFETGGRIDHVAIHLGDLRVAHASGYVRVDSLERSSPCFRPDLFAKYRFARRVAGVQGR